MSVSKSAAADQELIWEEIVNTLPNGSALHDAAFAQLQGSTEPFKVAIKLIAALPKELRKRSKLIVRTWATDETARQEQKAHRIAQERKIAEQIAAREAKTAQEIAVRRDRKEQRLHELALVRASVIVHGDALSKRHDQVGSSARQQRREKDLVIETRNDGSRWISEDILCAHSQCPRSAKGMTKGCCSEHGGRSKCTHPSNCPKVANSQKLCIAHGGGIPCKINGCTKNEERAGLCSAHGGVLKCESQGCRKLSASRGLCREHGGGRMCEYEGGCNNISERAGGTGLCIAHGGGSKCAVGGCGKKAYSKGMCHIHTERKECTYVGGCTNHVNRRGLCVSHGGKRKCKFDGGCHMISVRNGLCVEHGAFKKCEFEGGCEKYAVRKGMCVGHGGAKSNRCGFEGGCKTRAKENGFCCSHGGRPNCAYEGGCETISVRNGICAQHGALKKCEFEDGCKKYAKRMGKCRAHAGAKEKEVGV